MNTDLVNNGSALTLQHSNTATLCDGRLGLRTGLHVEIHEPAQSGTGGEGRGTRESGVAPASSPSSPAPVAPPPILDFIASSEALDRYDEILCASGWRLEHYRRNPVFQNAHQYGDILFTLGKALITEVRTGQLSTIHSQPSTYLFQRIEFAVDANPIARIAYNLYKGKFLNAVSVGFIPLRWEDADGTERNAERGVRNAEWTAGASELRTPHSAIRTQKFRRRYLEQELLEVSAVGIPANPEALQLGLKAGAIQKADLRDSLELLRAFTAAVRGGDSLSPHARAWNSHGDKLSPPQAIPPVAADLSPLHFPGKKIRADSRRLLQVISLARELRNLLRRA